MSEVLPPRIPRAEAGGSFPVEWDAKLSPGDEMGQCLKDWFDRLNTAYDAGEIRVSYDKWKRLTLAADRLFHEGLAAATDAEVALFRDVDERVRYAGSNRRNPGRP